MFTFETISTALHKLTKVCPPRELTAFLEDARLTALLDHATVMTDPRVSDLSTCTRSNHAGVARQSIRVQIYVAADI